MQFLQTTAGLLAVGKNLATESHLISPVTIQVVHGFVEPILVTLPAEATATSLYPNILTSPIAFHRGRGESLSG